MVVNEQCRSVILSESEGLSALPVDAAALRILSAAFRRVIGAHPR
jgi:hypothetical protein